MRFRPSNFGKFTFSGGWNHFFTWKAQPGSEISPASWEIITTARFLWRRVRFPGTRHLSAVEWEWRHFDFISTVNYVGDFRDDPSFSADQTAVGGPDFTGRIRTVPSHITLGHAVEL